MIMRHSIHTVTIIFLGNSMDTESPVMKGKTLSKSHIPKSTAGAEKTHMKQVASNTKECTGTETIQS